MLKHIKHLCRFSAPLDSAGIAAIGEQASRNDQNMMWAIERTIQHELRSGN